MHLKRFFKSSQSCSVSKETFDLTFTRGKLWVDKVCMGEHITDTYITETDTTELENLSHNIIDIFIIET